MSRRSRRRREASLAVAPSPSAISPRSLTGRLLRDLASPAPLRLIEDRRTFHPLQHFRPARTLSGHPVGPVTVKTSVNKRNTFIARGLRFDLPPRVAICVRRKKRKEVLHALKKTGKGKGGGRKRRNWYSNIGC